MFPPATLRVHEACVWIDTNRLHPSLRMLNWRLSHGRLSVHKYTHALSLRQFLFNQNTTSAAHLGRVARVNQYYTSTSLFRFARRELYQLIPCRIRDAFSKTPVLTMSFTFKSSKAITQTHQQIFCSIYEQSPLPPFNALMHPGDWSTSLSSVVFLFLLNRRCTLAKAFAQYGKNRGLVICSPVLSSKCCQSNINPDYFVSRWKYVWLYLTRKADIPLISRRTPDSEGSDCSFNRTVQHHPQSLNFRQVQPLTINLKPTLGISHGVIATVRLGILISGPCFQTSEERFKRQINPLSYILKYLRINLAQCWSVRLLIDGINLLVSCHQLVFVPAPKHLCDKQEFGCTTSDTLQQLTENRVPWSDKYGICTP